MASRRVGSLVLVAATFVCPARSWGQPAAGGATLAAILKKSAAYCQRLEGAALDFVCQEEVKELSTRFTPSVDLYLYDYQFVRKGKETKEQRRLLSVNGEKADEKEAVLKTAMFQYESVLFGPVGLLSEFWQARHEYRLAGREMSGRTAVAVIDALPGPLAYEPHCYGRIWVREDDGSVLKIVWDPKSVGNFKAMEEWAKEQGAEAVITAYSEYGLEKNGLRFPSRNYAEAAYLLPDKRRFVSGMISVAYKKYKFFTVETEVTF
jgi:hypothetical protein